MVMNLITRPWEHTRVHNCLRINWLWTGLHHIMLQNRWHLGRTSPTKSL